ncbi:MAG TPA: hypothetical protein VME63_13970 [Dyella sp.]|uniref:hypothetical protein n=1 Tax=Dyella sp. TaxID=1869338 RepID=UPI002CAAF586|nr:hypothetical protein [Dyella sp.]HTV86505.1 hypothetical protein [Dyella sp.]
MNRAALLATVLLCGVIAACGNDADSDMLNGSIRLSHDQITLHAKDAPDAVIGANGDLTIDQQAIQTSPAERELLKRYYDNVLMIRTDGIATGKAGVAVGAQAMKSVAQGLANGNSDQIQQQIDAKTKAVTDAAMKICQDLANVKINQDQLVAQLPAFKPYANVISGSDVGDCRKDQ